MARLVATLPVPERLPRRDPYPALLQSIVHQQLSMKAAATIWLRLESLLGGTARTASPDVLLALSEPALRGAGLSRQKVQYARSVAEFARAGGLEACRLGRLDDESLIRCLTGIRGVGRWTAEMLLIFALGREDVFAVDDLGLQQSMQQLYQLERVQGVELKRQMKRIAAAWSPHRTLACRYLWLWKQSGS
jgi:DNA-3-methyladenine glycosylase II